MIREMQESDIPQCIYIVEKNWGDKVAQRAEIEVRCLFKNQLAMYYVIELNHTVVGWAGMMPSHLMNDIWDFIWINIHPDFKKQGLGRDLTNFRINMVSEMGGSAIHLMTKRYKFFKSMGFKAVHVYQGNWVLMIRQLKTVEL